MAAALRRHTQRAAELRTRATHEGWLFLLALRMSPQRGGSKAQRGGLKEGRPYGSSGCSLSHIFRAMSFMLRQMLRVTCCRSLL